MSYQRKLLVATVEYFRNEYLVSYSMIYELLDKASDGDDMRYDWIFDQMLRNNIFNNYEKFRDIDINSNDLDENASIDLLSLLLNMYELDTKEIKRIINIDEEFRRQAQSSIGSIPKYAEMMYECVNR